MEEQKKIIHNIPPHQHLHPQTHMPAHDRHKHQQQQQASFTTYSTKRQS